MNSASTAKALNVVVGDTLIVQGQSIRLPLTEAGLISVLGQPDRIMAGEPPAPAGYRNNEAYIYDNLGVYWLRDHKTLNFGDLTAVFCPGTLVPKRFTPACMFSGTIQFPQYELTSRSSAAELGKAMRGALKPMIGGFMVAKIGPFTISFLAGRPSAVARSSMQLELQSVSIDFAH